jgi:hypothetical protein
MPDTNRQLILSAAHDALLAAFPNGWAIYFLSLCCLAALVLAGGLGTDPCAWTPAG